MGVMRAVGLTCRLLDVDRLVIMLRTRLGELQANIVTSTVRQSCWTGCIT